MNEAKKEKKKSQGRGKKRFSPLFLSSHYLLHLPLTTVTLCLQAHLLTLFSSLAAFSTNLARWDTTKIGTRPRGKRRKRPAHVSTLSTHQVALLFQSWNLQRWWGRRCLPRSVIPSPRLSSHVKALPSFAKCALLFFESPTFFYLESGGRAWRLWTHYILAQTGSCEEWFSPGVSACRCRGKPSKCMNIKRTLFLLWLFCCQRLKLRSLLSL